MKEKIYNTHASFLVTPLWYDEPQGQEGGLKRTKSLVDLKEENC
jgi:hypothetical protein